MRGLTPAALLLAAVLCSGAAQVSNDTTGGGVLGAPERSARGLPGRGRRQRAALSQAEGVAGRGNALREDRPLLHRRALPRRQHRLAQTLTEPNMLPNILC